MKKLMLMAVLLVSGFGVFANSVTHKPKKHKKHHAIAIHKPAAQSKTDAKQAAARK